MTWTSYTKDLSPQNSFISTKWAQISRNDLTVLYYLNELKLRQIEHVLKPRIFKRKKEVWFRMFDFTVPSKYDNTNPITNYGLFLSSLSSTTLEQNGRKSGIKKRTVYKKLTLMN